MTDSRRSEWPLIGKCDVCGNEGMKLKKYYNEYLCKSCLIQEKAEDDSEKVISSHDDFIDFFRETFDSTTTGKAE